MFKLRCSQAYNYFKDYQKCVILFILFVWEGMLIKEHLIPQMKDNKPIKNKINHQSNKECLSGLTLSPQTLLNPMHVLFNLVGLRTALVNWVRKDPSKSLMGLIVDVCNLSTMIKYKVEWIVKFMNSDHPHKF